MRCRAKGCFEDLPNDAWLFCARHYAIVPPELRGGMLASFGDQEKWREAIKRVIEWLWTEESNRKSKKR